MATSAETNTSAEAEPRSTKRVKLDFTELSIIVGEAKEKFTVHKGFIKSSKFLEAASRGPWQESQTKTITLPEADPKIFSVYLQWLYTGDVVIQDDDSSVNPAELSSAARKNLIDPHYGPICDLAVLADQLDDVKLRNKVVDLILISARDLAKIPSPELSCRIRRSLPETSHLRRLIVDLYATIARPEKVMELKDSFQPDFVFDVMLALKKDFSRREKLVTPSYANRCKYHEHAKDEARCV